MVSALLEKENYRWIVIGSDGLSLRFAGVGVCLGLV